MIFTMYLAPLRTALLRTAPLRSTPLRTAPLRSTQLRSALLRSALLRSAALRSTPLRTAPLRSTQLPPSSPLNHFQCLSVNSFNSASVYVFSGILLTYLLSHHYRLFFVCREVCSELRIAHAVPLPAERT